MEKSLPITIALLFVGFVLNAQTAYDKKLQSLYKYTVPQAKVIELKSKLASNQKLILLDTRSPGEYKVSHIPGATLVDYDNFNLKAVEDIDRDAEVIVYCTVGYRSERIGEKLQGMGFTNVKNLYGGIFQWANEEGPLLNDKNVPTDSVHTFSRRWSQWLQRGIKVYE